jgi:hypothetical protein
MKTLSQRIEYIRQRNEAANKDTNKPAYPIKNWRGKHTLYPKIIQVDVDYLMFRLENSRTEIQQMKYLRDNPTLPKDLFSNPESALAQEAQEIILNEINKDAGKDFFNDLNIRGQDEAAIISYDGYLINGNRRTAALKTLGTRYIDCAVLPEDTTPKDLYELEQELQISQDFRERYHWINELRNIKRGIEDKRYNFKEDEMARRLRININEIKAKRRMLELIDSFLIWKGIPGEYDYNKLDETEQIFIQLEKALKKYKDEQKLEELKNAVFTLIEEKPSKGRLYGYVMDLIKNFDKIYEKIRSTTPAENEKQNSNGKTSDNDILNDILNSEDDEEIKPIFGSSDNAVTNAATLVERIADIKAENKEKVDNESVYESVSSALRELQGLTIDDDTAKLDSIKSKLEQIISTSQALLSQVKSFEI